jgi:hypothetical protein
MRAQKSLEDFCQGFFLKTFGPPIGHTAGVWPGMSIFCEEKAVRPFSGK